ncbi:hypothetical protein RvY_13907 [Ramazzottius varieornatus]|uniref:Protein DPCD n=1 Tax=Ramazzottius varieornatus TaxID=947166 RepID=A0A1D1VRA1_RAMVA|nr:hypothetical protein RvY_13907 [Ramazzottius varieornatus]
MRTLYQPVTMVVVLRIIRDRFYKELPMPDMDRMQLDVAQDGLGVTHANNTLVIKYRKPKYIVELERLLRMEVQGLPDKEAKQEKEMMESVTKMMENVMKRPANPSQAIMR